ncbi:hypothetical protein JW933_02085 [candidate division FCPU426 bacterium]|nr:hypothetical protein [candidate division FCPU426 bacterium]
MPEEKKTIFRSEAIEQYIREREESVLPRWIRPPVFKIIWLLVALVLAAGIAASFMRIPVMACGQGWCVPPAAADARPAADVQMVLLLPASVQGRLRRGQPVSIRNTPAFRHGEAVIIEVEPGLLSPADLYSRHPGILAAGAAIRQPQAVALARWTPLAQAEAGSGLSGSLYTVCVQTGFLRLVNYIPGIQLLLKDGGV